jgi:predicted porin
MKKSLLALAAMGAFAGAAQAQSSVTVYGLLDQSVVVTDTKALATGISTKTTNTGGDGQMAGSRLGFRGTEDLGGGLRANFVFEMGMSASEQNNGLAFGTRLGYVELASTSVGAIRAGRQVSPTKAVNDGYTTFGNSTFASGAVAGSTETADTTNYLSTANAGDRVGNAITYLTPVFSGFQAQLQIAQDNSSSAGVDTTRAVSTTSDLAGAQLTAQTNQVNFGASYTMGNYSIMFGRADQMAKASSVDTATTHNALGASAKFGTTTVFATYNIKTVKVASVQQNERSDWTLGVNHSIGKVDLKAAYGMGKVDQAAGTGTVGVHKLTGIQGGAFYNLSKRTNVYAALGQTTTKTDGSSNEATRLGYIAGVRHTF